MDNTGLLAPYYVLIKYIINSSRAAASCCHFQKTIAAVQKRTAATAGNTGNAIAK
jgi:hypothetical protein